MSDNVQVIAKPNLFSSEVFRAVLTEGTNLGQFLTGVDQNVYKITLNSFELLDWDYAVKPGDLINIYRIPEGGGDGGSGKEVLSMVAQLVVLAGAIATAGFLAGATGILWTNSLVAQGVITAVVGIAGNMLVSVLFPPQIPTTDDVSTKPTFSGQKNVATPYKPIPKVYGEYRFAPPLAAQSYTDFGLSSVEIIDGKWVMGMEDKSYGQFIVGLLCLGYASLEIGQWIMGLSGSTDVKSIKMVSDEEGVLTVVKIYNDDTILDITSQWDSQTIKIGNSAITLYNSWEIEIGFMESIDLYKNIVKQENFSEEFSNSASNSENRDSVTLDGRTMFSTVALFDPGDPVPTDLWWPQVDAGVPIESWAVRSTQYGVPNVRVEFAFYTGLNQLSKEGPTSYMGVEVYVYIAPIGTLVSSEGTWEFVTKKTFWDNTKDPFQEHIEFNIADTSQTPGEQYDVLIYRIGTWTEQSIPSWYRIYTDFKWIFLRSFEQNPPFLLDNVLLMSYKILATDQLSGSLDNVNIITKSYLRYLDTPSTFAYKLTANPAWIFLDVLTGIQNEFPIPDNRLDLQAIYDWGAWCDEQGIEYNWVELQQETMFERMRSVATTGFASWNIVEGLFTIVRDLAGQTPIQMLTQRNSVNFSSVKNFGDVPHALRVKYINPLKWEEDDIVAYNDEYNADGSDGLEKAVIINDLETKGVTSHEQAYREGRYHLASMLLRPEVFTIDLDFENLTCNRGDLVTLSHDTILVGMKPGRIKAINDIGGGQVTITSDEELGNDGLETYGVTIRTEENEQLSSEVTLAPGINITEFTATIDVAKINIGDLFIFGVYGSVDVRCKVTQIEYHQNLSATLTLVDEAPSILDSHTDPIPEYDPGTTSPLDLTNLVPPVPVLIAVNSNSATLIKDIDGSFKASVTVVYSLNRSGVIVGAVELRYKSIYSSGLTYKYVKTTPDNTFIRLTDVSPEDRVEVQVRSISIYNKPSAWSDATTVYVIGKEYPPSDVENFSVFMEDNKLKGRWTHILDADRDEYEIRVSPAYDPGNPPGLGWDNLDFLWRGKANETDLGLLNPPGHYTFGIKAIDTSNIESSNMASTVIEINFSGISGLKATIDKATMTLTWSLINNTFKVNYYEIFSSDTDTFSALNLKTSVNTTAYSKRIEKAQDRYWWVRAVDDAGIEGIESIVDVPINLASILTVKATVLDNNVLLQWTEDGTGTIETLGYKVLRGDVFVSATEIGFSSTTFSNIFELDGGEKTYWIVPVDLVGNEGTEKSVIVEVNQPPNFQLLDLHESDFKGGTGITITSAYVGVWTNLYRKTTVADGDNILLFGSRLQYEQTSWDGVFEPAGFDWANTDAKSTAGYSHFLTPSKVTADAVYYQEQIDYQAIVEAATISFEFNTMLITGTGTYTVTPKIETSPDNSVWTTYDNTQSIFTSNFRYVRYKLTIDLANDKQIVQVQDWKARLFVQEKLDSGYIDNMNQLLDESDFANPVSALSLVKSSNCFADRSGGPHVSFDLIDATDYTVEWIGIIPKIPTGGVSAKWYLLAQDYVFGLGVIISGGKLYPTFYWNDGGGTNFSSEQGSQEVPVGELVHIAWKADSGSGDGLFYVNGQPGGIIGDVSIGDPGGGGDLILGKKMDREDDNANVDVLMDLITVEFRIWPGLGVSDANILANYDKPYTGTLPSNLTCYYRFFTDEHSAAKTYSSVDGSTTLTVTTDEDYVWAGVWIPMADFLDIDIITLTVEGTEYPGATMLADYKDIPNPTGFMVHMLDIAPATWEIVDDGGAFTYFIKGV